MLTYSEAHKLASHKHTSSRAYKLARSETNESTSSLNQSPRAREPRSLQAGKIRNLLAQELTSPLADELTRSSVYQVTNSQAHKPRQKGSWENVILAAVKCQESSFSKLSV